jgi:hypothetical protein
MNQAAVTAVIPLEHVMEGDVLFAGALASQEANQDLIHLVFLARAEERPIFDGAPAVEPAPFSPFDVARAQFSHPRR